MPIKQAAKKDIRQNAKRKARNLGIKRKLHDLIQDFDKALADEKFDDAQKMLPTIQKQLDKAAKSYMHKSTASRTVSRLEKRLATAKK